MKLCKVCGPRGNEKDECHICKGKAMSMYTMLDEAVEAISSKNISSFSISTLIPKDWLIREEEIWDRKLDENSESIKHRINRKTASELRRRVSLRYGPDGDCRIIFDYGNGNVKVQMNNLYIFGRYKKLVPGLSQTRWICSGCGGKGCAECGDEGKRYLSVEELVGIPIKKQTEAEDYVLHASGREDVDATNSAGRIFVITIKNPKKREIGLEKIKARIDETEKVSVEDLKVVGRRFLEFVTESHFDKTYTANIEFKRKITETDIKKIESLEGKVLLQRTPKRVARRRADKVRHRRIKKLNVIEIKENTAIIQIKAEAGTYIKEMISGDGKRTVPSIAELLETEAMCTKLDVTEINDEFIDFCLEKSS